MEIIRPGKLPSSTPKRYEGGCRNCHCFVRCDEAEVGFLGDYRRQGTVACPTTGCGVAIDVKLIVYRGADNDATDL